MNRYIFILAALAFAALAGPVEAATCFWVGGTASWSTANTASWASSTGGTTGTCAATGGVPKNSIDIATFDGASGGGTVTVDSTMNGLTINSISMAAFTGTIDFSVNNPSMTFAAGVGSDAINNSGTGSGRILKLGSGTFTFTGNNFNFLTTTNAGVQSYASATLVFNSSTTGGAQTFSGGGQTFGTVTINGRTGSSGQGFQFNPGASSTITTVNISGPVFAAVTATTSYTITNLNISGSNSAFAYFGVASQSNTTQTINVTTSSVDHAIMRNLVFGTSAVTATNSIDMGNNNMNGGSIAAPTSGSGGRIIGG